jgi:hypothetical protein
LALLRLGGPEWIVRLAKPPLPDESALRRLVVRPAAGVLRVSIEDDALALAGASTNLRAVADELAAFVEYNDLDQPGTHCHIDPSEDRSWIAPDSALTVAGWALDH